MTTIAWDGKTLAADRQLTTSGVRYETTKAHRLKNGSLFASCGALECLAAALAWLNGESEKPVFVEADEFDGILIKPDGSAWSMGKKLCPIRIESPYFATGSGRDFALVAMRMGKSAREAIEIASELDIWSGMGVTELRIESKPEIRLTEGNVFWLSESGEALVARLNADQLVGGS